LTSKSSSRPGSKANSTGYSSLSYLSSFPFDKIKIGRSFVRELDANADSQAIVRTIASRGITITAEGARRRDLLSLATRAHLIPPSSRGASRSDASRRTRAADAAPLVTLAHGSRRAACAALLTMRRRESGTRRFEANVSQCLRSRSLSRSLVARHPSGAAP
jgi:predicted signal transduction protein with EAL and GGDEF domain